MKTQPKTLRFPIFFLSFLVVAVGVMVCRQLWQESDSQASQVTEAASVGEASVQAGGRKAAQVPRLASPLLESSGRAEAETAAAEKKAASNQTERDRFFAEERRIMAKTWGLSAEKEADFEIGVRDGLRDRQAVFDRLTRGEITAMDVGAQLDAAEERARKQLLDVLGPDRLLEYQLMHGHFVEAGLDHKPFVPPTVVSAPEGAAQPASAGPQPQSTSSASL